MKYASLRNITSCTNRLQSGRSAAYTLIETAKLNGINPQAWLTDVLGHIADQKITRSAGCSPGVTLQLSVTGPTVKPQGRRSRTLSPDIKMRQERTMAPAEISTAT